MQRESDRFIVTFTIVLPDRPELLFPLALQSAVGRGPWLTAVDYWVTLNPLSPHDAVKQHFTSLKTNFPTTKGFRLTIFMKLVYQLGNFL